MHELSHDRQQKNYIQFRIIVNVAHYYIKSNSFNDSTLFLIRNTFNLGFQLKCTPTDITISLSTPISESNSWSRPGNRCRDLHKYY